MTWRDELFSSASNLVLAGPLSSTAVERIPVGLLRYLESDAGRQFRYRETADGWVPVPRAEVAARLRASTVRLADGLDTEGIAHAVERIGHRELAILIVIAGSTVGIAFSHRYSDGTVAMGALQSALGGAVDTAPRLSRFPVLRALMQTGNLRLGAIRAARARLHAHHELIANAPRSRADAELRVARILVPTRALSALAAAEPLLAGRRPPTTAVLSAFVFRSIAAGLPAGVDLPVRMQVGLRRHLGEGWTTAGNFAAGPVVGTLREREWAAADYVERVAPRIADPGVVAEFAVEGLAHLRARLRGARLSGARTGEVPLSFSFNVVPGGVGFRPEDGIDGVTPEPTLFMVDRGGKVGPHLSIAATGRAFVLTVVDDSGLLDLRAVERALATAGTGTGTPSA